MKRINFNIKDRKTLFVVLGLMIVSVSTLTIAYAVLSSTLIISGSAEIGGSSWGITVSKFDVRGNSNMSDEEIDNFAAMNGFKIYDNGMATGDAELIKEATISGTTISGLQISLVKPGYMVNLYYTVTNNGTIPAEIESIILNTPSFSSSTNNTNDIELIANNWSSDMGLFRNSLFSNDARLDVGDILCPGDTIYFGFNSKIEEYTATAVSSSDITVSNLGGTVNFVQADKSTCSNS